MVHSGNGNIDHLRVAISTADVAGAADGSASLKQACPSTLVFHRIDWWLSYTNMNDGSCRHSPRLMNCTECLHSFKHWSLQSFGIDFVLASELSNPAAKVC